ncbi:MAG: helix-turn-helix transcriptional regulator, partial [bacterium]|nr:helix-turn-helix transcriptional regulator [bacterium]
MSNKKFKLDAFSMQNFGTRLREARKKLGLNPAQISEAIGVEKNSYYKYEDSSRFPKPEILAALVLYLNLDVNYLITGVGEMFLTRTPLTDNVRRAALLETFFPGIPPETYPLIESLEIPIMKH